MIGKGWHRESMRHSEARLYGKASGGSMKAPSLKGNSKIKKFDKIKVKLGRNEPIRDATYLGKGKTKDSIKISYVPRGKNNSSVIADMDKSGLIEVVKSEKIKGLSQEESDRQKFSFRAEKGLDIYASMSAKNMRETAEEYTKRTGKNAYDVSNKADFYEFVYLRDKEGGSASLSVPFSFSATGSNRDVAMLLDQKIKESGCSRSDFKYSLTNEKDLGAGNSGVVKIYGSKDKIDSLKKVLYH